MKIYVDIYEWTNNAGSQAWNHRWGEMNEYESGEVLGIRCWISPTERNPPAHWIPSLISQSFTNWDLIWYH